MECVITAADIFNSSYNLKSKRVTFKELFACAVNSGTLTNEEVSLKVGEYKLAVTDIALSDYEESDDIYYIIKETSKKYMAAIDNYLNMFDNPFKALMYLYTNTPTDVLKNAMREYEEFRSYLVVKLDNLASESKELTTLDSEYANYLDYLRNKINDKTGWTVYTLMCGLNPMDAVTLEDVSKLIDASISELNIIKKFPKLEVIKMLKGFKLDDLSKNIAATAIYNYFFNSFYKGGTEVSLTEAQDKIVKSGIKSGFFDSEDIVDVIETGDIEFSHDDKKYIYCYFVPTFQEEIIENKFIDRTIKG